jgi:hypothetical protein
LKKSEELSIEDADADIADTLRENVSVGNNSFNAEYDVIDEDEAKLSKKLNQNNLNRKSIINNENLLKNNQITRKVPMCYSMSDFGKA